MTQHFLQYWIPSAVDRMLSSVEQGEDDGLTHTAGSQLSMVSPGDVVWIVTIRTGQFCLVGRIDVGRVVGQPEAEKHFGQELWQAECHVIASPGDVCPMCMVDISDLARHLRFESPVKSLPAGFTGQHLQRLRQLTPESVLLLEQKLPPKDTPQENVRLEVGRAYSRRDDLHRRFGGQQQGGIATPADKPFILLFTGNSGEQYGYKDGWDENGVFIYTGEGQEGDMKFVRGNRAIRNHVRDGKSLWLFESVEKGHARYTGEFACASWETRPGHDVNGNDRTVIVFHLLPVDALSPEVTQAEPKANVDELRRRAYDAATEAIEAQSTDAKRILYARSTHVRQYVLARADGVCESCARPAPFSRKNGTAYLEPHHTRRVADGGPDDPRWVGGVCPNCHREIHFGEHGTVKNEELQEHLTELESKD